MITPPQFVRRENLGWLIPILLLAVFYGGYLFFHETGSLRQAGLLFCVVGVVGLSLSRRVRRLVKYHMRPKTDERRAAFVSAVEMDRAKRQANKEKIPELICHLYFYHIAHYPELIGTDKEHDTAVIPDIITKAQNSAGNRTTIAFGDKEYIFTFVRYVYSTPEGERADEGTLQVSSPDQKLFLVHLAMRLHNGKQELRPVSLEYISLSDWVNDMRHLSEQIEKKQKRERHEDEMN